MNYIYPNGAVVKVPPGAPVPPGFSGLELERQDVETLVANLRIDAHMTEQWLQEKLNDFARPGEKQ